MPILWGYTGYTSSLALVLMNSALESAQVYDQTQAIVVQVTFDVPAALSTWVNHCHEFRLRVFSESIGPGQQGQIAEAYVRGVHNLTRYKQDIEIPAGRLKAEGEILDAGIESLGLYRISAVLQHLNVMDPGCPPPDQRVSTVNSGASDISTLIAIKRAR